MTTNNNWRNSWKKWLLVFNATVTAFSVPAFAQDTDDEDLEEVEGFTVTGSRIARIDLETPNPVIRFSREDLLNTGFTNLGEALRSLPFNSSQAVSAAGSNIGFASGTETVNLRGLGNNNTLVLINGRRAVPSGAGAVNGFLSVIDINSIPASAIESMEILKDGASAIYGSDAVAGVLNVNLRKDYVGAGLEVYYGNTFDADSAEKSIFGILGSATAKTSIVATFDWFEKNAVANRDYDFSTTADQRPDKTNPDFFTIGPDGRLNGIDWRSSRGMPARFITPGGDVRTLPALTDNPLVADIVPVDRNLGYGYYDYQKVSWQFPEVKRKGFNFFATHDITENLYVFAEASYRQIEILNQAAESPFTTTDAGAGTNNRLVVSADSPFNPYGERYFPGAGQSIELLNVRLLNAGPRVTDATSIYPRLVTGVGGTALEFDWEAAAMWTKGSYENLNPGTSFDRQYQEALLGVNIDGQVLYANPFGPEDPRITSYYSGYNPVKSTFETRLVDFSASGPIMELPGGSLGIAFGGEYRESELVDARTTDNETGNVVGGSEGFSFTGTRDVMSFFAELSIPVTQQIEVQLAARYEDYSDFGDTTKPKIAAKWRINDWLLVRGSYSGSFKAPDLALLYTEGNVSFTPSAIIDPKRPGDDASQIKTLGRGNVDLQPEETDTYSAGIILEPTEDFTIEVSYFRFDQENLITRDGAEFTLNNEDNLPAGRVIRDDPTPADIAAGLPGRLNSIATDWFNADNFIYEGVDVSISYIMETEDWGNFRFGADFTRVLTVERTDTDSLGNTFVSDFLGNQAGLYPKLTATFTLAWTKGDWAASIFTTYQDQLTDTFWPDLGSYVRVNPSVSYSGLWDTTITVGARNIFDENPPFDFSASGDGYYAGVHNPEPLFWYVRIGKEF